jgi:hypothetical protein
VSVEEVPCNLALQTLRIGEDDRARRRSRSGRWHLREAHYCRPLAVAQPLASASTRHWIRRVRPFSRTC